MADLPALHALSALEEIRQSDRLTVERGDGEEIEPSSMLALQDGCGAVAAEAERLR
jgi:hypothetical protein